MPRLDDAIFPLRFDNRPLDPDRLLNELALALNSEPDNNTISIDNQRGNGSIRRLGITEGLEVFFWDIELRHAKELKNISLNQVSDKTFTILCTLSPEHLQFRKKGQPLALPNILFTTLDKEIDFYILPGQKSKSVIIHFSAGWLKEECKGADPDKLFMMHDMVSQDTPVFFMEQASFSIYQMFSDVHSQASGGHIDTLRIKAKIISVIHDLLGHLLTFFNKPNKEANNLLHTIMSEVEKILNEHLESNLPSICTIAKQLALSESTLKRNFKQAYGVGIYEHYLQKKMQLARKLLDEKPVTVNEVAHMLGYEKTSNFIKIFRKYYDHSPGSLKKKFPHD